MKAARIEYFLSGVVRPRWYWRLRTRNGKTIADGSEGYSSRSNVRRAVKRLLMIMGKPDIEIVEVEYGQTVRP
jgi:hypothetical protein